MPLTIHHLEISQSDRIIWLCEELSIPYDLKRYPRSPILAPPEFKALHPIGGAPVIQDGSLTLAESAACAEYIAQVHGGGRLVVKPGEEGYADYLYWFHFANGTLTPGMMRLLMISQLSPDSSSDSSPGPIVANIQNKFRLILTSLNERLSSPSSPYLAGANLSLADIISVCSLTTLRSFIPVDLSEYPSILAYLKRVADRPAYRAAMKKGDPELDVDALISAEGPPRFTPKPASK
ncbi:putative glutathione S-transferase [Xylariaceae sp. FL0255]|nr:putative glutathione S-transferase [Xylariaceae sp. FL0255]